MTIDVALPPSPAALRASTSASGGEAELHLSPGGRGRTRSVRVRGAASTFQALRKQPAQIDQSKPSFSAIRTTTESSSVSTSLFQNRSTE